MNKHPRLWITGTFLLWAVACGCLRVEAATTITVLNMDGPNEGFNDPTPVTPVGGNNGTTLGQQRLNVFSAAAAVWEAQLSSSVPILVSAQFDPLPCTPFGAVLGRAGPVNAFRDFAGAPVPGTFYVSALANAVAGTDLDPANPDIDATFSSTIGTSGCAGFGNWYYGLDGNAPGGTLDLFPVVLHELGHGLGFLTLVSLTTGQKFMGQDDAFMRFLENHATGASYPTMSDGERVSASTATGQLHWTGTNVIATATGFLTAGRGAGGHVEMYAPASQQPGSSVSHFSDSLTPDELMEPFLTSSPQRILTLALFKDIGWPTPGGPQLPSISIGDDFVIESNSGTTNAVFQVTLSAPGAQVVTVGFGTADNTATAGSDYVAASGTLAFSPGVTNLTVTVQVIGDTIPESNEIFFVNLSNPVNATISDNQGAGNIVDDDSGALIIIDDVTVLEGDAGSTNAVFTVRLSLATNQVVTVDYSTADGTATAGADYSTRSGSVTFPGGTTSRTITVPVLGDTLLEATETFLVNLANATNALIVRSQAIGTILDDDSPPANDLCAGAVLIDPLPASYTQSTKTATTSGDPAPGCIPTLGKGVWYKVTAQVNGMLVVDSIGSDFDTGIAVYSGSCSPLILAACDDDGGGGTASRVMTQVDAGTSYYILAGGKNGASGSLTVNFSITGFPPRIISTPTHTNLTTAITIDGQNFHINPANNIVYFGPVRASVTGSGATALTVVVPPGVAYAPISVTVNGLTAWAPLPFGVTFNSTRQLTNSSFQAKADLVAGSNPRSLVLGDFNNDGKPDLAAANFNSGTLSVFRNIGSLGAISAGSFATPTTLTAGSGPYVVAAGDLDGDGRLDLAVVNYNAGTVSLFRNTSNAGGAVSFAAKVDLATGLNPRAVHIGDVDIDGLADVIVANEGSSSVSVFRNTGTGGITANAFASRVDFIVGTQPTALAWGDLDGDGRPDLIVANGFNGPGGNTISVLRNASTPGTIGSGSFATRVNVPTGAAPLSAALADLDEDGKLDVVVANSGNSSVSVFRNTNTVGTVGFGMRTNYPSGSTTRTVAVGDVDGDGKPDLIIANETVSTVSVLQNTSTNQPPYGISFAPRVIYNTASNPFGVAVGDVDRDGKPELLTANTSGSISILRNQLKADSPGVGWTPPNSIDYGTPLGAAQLNATAAVQGNFAYAPGPGSVLGAGTHTLSATFIPFDSSTYNTTNITTTITVNPVPLTVTPAAASRSYGAANPTFTGTVTGLTNADNITVNYTSLATPATPVGDTSVITVTLNDPDNRLGNYFPVTLNQATLTITNAPLIVNVNNASRAYGAADPVFSVTFIGLANNDIIGTDIFTTVGATAPPGIYPDSIQVFLSGDALANYVSFPPVNPGTLTVTPALLTLTATATNRTYGATNPVFTGTVNGLVNNEDVFATFGSVATPASPVGAYAITVSSLNGSALANYAVKTNTGTLTVTKAPLTVTPDNTNRVFGVANPAFTGTVTGLLNNDAITPNYASAATLLSPPGNYDITATLTDPTSKLGNYTATLNKGVLTVTRGDAPVITLSSNVLNYVENAGPVVLNGGATVTDGGSPDFDTGVLTVELTAGGAAEDQLAIRHQGASAGQIGVYGATVTLGGTNIGTFSGGAGGSSPLVITLNPRATPPATQVLLRNLTYENVSENPATNARTLQIVLTDGDGGTSAPVTMTLNVVAVNDAPNVTWLAPTNSAALKAPGPFLLQASAADVDGTIQQVEFFAGTASLGVAINAPYQVTWTNVAVGSYTLRAVATDQGTLKGTNSPLIAVSVNPGFNAQQVTTTGQFQLTLTGASGIKYDVEVSTDLRNWVKIGEVTAGIGATPFLDTQQISLITQRFYRFRVHTP